jgi:NADPH2:quinone reductase
MKSQAIVMHSQGKPDVMVVEEVDVGTPGPGQAVIRQTAVGVNYLDVYHRSGVYPLPLPSRIGSEGAGVVEALGTDVTHIKVGDHVAYQGGDIGSYSTRRLMQAARLYPIPAGVSDEQAAAVMLKGMTVEYLLDRSVSLKAGDYALMYAAAGGVGLLAGQWAKARGIKMIGVAAGKDKCAQALANGYHVVIDRNSEDILGRVKEITDGKMLPVVFDSIGKATFDISIDCLAPRGFFISFGATSGAPPAVEAGLLQKKGSLYFSRPTLVHYCSSPEDYAMSAGKVLGMVASGALKPIIGQHYALKDAAQAHIDLESGKTTGATILLP